MLDAPALRDLEAGPDAGAAVCLLDDDEYAMSTLREQLDEQGRLAAPEFLSVAESA
jgi:hypothetical protein